MAPERRLHISLCDYLKVAYPKVIFLSESSGIRVSQGLSSLLKRTRSNHTHLDLYILEPVGEYHGLILELKAKTIFKKDGSLKADSKGHIDDQFETIEKFRKKGYYATFCWSLDDGIKIIDNYLHGNY